MSLHIMQILSEFLKYCRKEANLTQEEFSDRTGIALTVIRKIEQGKTNLNLDKVNMVLKCLVISLPQFQLKI